MTQDEADNLARRLKAHFSTITDEQLIEDAGKLQRYSLAVGKAVVDRLIDRCTEFSTALLMEGLRTEQARRKPPVRYERDTRTAAQRAADEAKKAQWAREVRRRIWNH